MKIIPDVEKTPELQSLGSVTFGSAFLFHEKPNVTSGYRHGSLSDPHILTSADSPARVVNLENGNTFCVDFYETFVEVIKTAEVTL